MLATSESAELSTVPAACPPQELPPCPREVDSKALARPPLGVKLEAILLSRLRCESLQNSYPRQPPGSPPPGLSSEAQARSTSRHERPPRKAPRSCLFPLPSPARPAQLPPGNRYKPPGAPAQRSVPVPRESARRRRLEDRHRDATLRLAEFLQPLQDGFGEVLHSVAIFGFELRIRLVLSLLLHDFDCTPGPPGVGAPRLASRF